MCVLRVCLLALQFVKTKAENEVNQMKRYKKERMSLFPLSYTFSREPKLNLVFVFCVCVQRTILSESKQRTLCVYIMYLF